MTVEKYLGRIGYSGPLTVTIETLFALHRAHVSSIPFENLHIIGGEKINLSPDFLFHKIIESRRGGICYELNALFYQLLSQLGFRVFIVSAVTRYGEEYGEDYDHMALVVEVDNQEWLVDVGLREALWHPLSLSKQTWYQHGLRSYSVRRYSNSGFRFMKKIQGEEHEEYKFIKDGKRPDQFRHMFRFHESNPRSPINRQLICCIATENGRAVIKGNKLISEENGKTSENLLNSGWLSYTNLKDFCIRFGFDQHTLEKIFFVASTQNFVAPDATGDLNSSNGNNGRKKSEQNK